MNVRNENPVALRKEAGLNILTASFRRTGEKMKKRMISSVLTALLLTLSPAMCFASTTSSVLSEAEVIQNADQLSQYLSTHESLTDEELQLIKENVSDEVIANYIGQQLQEGMEAIPVGEQEAEMTIMPDGTSYGKQEYQISDECTIIVELEEGSDDLSDYILTGESSAIQPMATNGEKLWKDYGNRYFTAKVSAVTGVGLGYAALGNHYILSAKGIDENFGDPYAIISASAGIVGTIDAIGAYITDASARTVGASDVNMYARYQINYSVDGVVQTQGNLVLSTSVGYVDHDYTDKQIQVVHKWSKS